MNARSKALLIGLLLSLLVIACSQGTSDGVESVGLNRQELKKPRVPLETSSPQTISLDIPLDATLDELSLTAADSLTLRAKVEVEGGVANVGGNPTTIGTDAVTHNLWSAGPVELRPNATIDGDLHAATSPALKPGATITGNVEITPTPIRPTTLSWSTEWEEPSDATVSTYPHRTTELKPGSYSSVIVGPQARLALSSGTYFIRQLEVKSEGELSIDSRDGEAVVVYILDSVDYAGTTTFTRATDRFAIVYLGTGAARFHSSFSGTIIAPHAALELGQGQKVSFAGSFFARSIEAGPLAVIRHVPFAAWDHLLVIKKVTLSPTEVCPNGTFTVSVDAEDPSTPRVGPSVNIYGAPVSEYSDQFRGPAGLRRIPVAAVSSDGQTAGLQILTLTVKNCPASDVLPELLVFENLRKPDHVDFIVANAEEFEDGTESYEWDFGDGFTQVTAYPTTTHDYTGSIGRDIKREPFNVTVTVTRDGLTDASATRTIVVWNTYAITKQRGSVRPPTEALEPRFDQDGPDYVGKVRLRNREDATLTLSTRRVDREPCDPDDSGSFGAEEPVDIHIPPHETVVEDVRLPGASFDPSICGVTVHYWGDHTDGQNAHTSVFFEGPPRIYSGTPVPDFLRDLLNYVVEHELADDPHSVTDEELLTLYRQRRLHYSAATNEFYDAAPEPTPEGRCDPSEPGSPPQAGYVCQPTGEWVFESPDGTPAQDYIANAHKGDALLVRSCGFLEEVFQSLDPPQKFTHSGIMSRNQSEVTQSTGLIEYLLSHSIGVGGKPTDGFEEDALRFLWPGTITGSVEEAFRRGIEKTDPDGRPRKVRGFSRGPTRCQSDANIIHPRVLKPPPAQDSSARSILHEAADIAKNKPSHYRFSLYSDATLLGSEDPDAPDWGPEPTVCSGLIRQSLKETGTIVDSDLTLPLPSNRGSAPDGLFVYNAKERRAGAYALHSWLYNMVQSQLGTAVDQEWWGGPVDYLTLGEGPWVIELFSDAGDDVANQIVNCFASDSCGQDAKDSTEWQSPGSGIAVSPDDMFNHYDSPTTGGVYGFHEPMVYRSKRFQPVFTWQPAAGTRPVAGTVFRNGSAVEDATVEVVGQPGAAMQTDANGRFEFGAIWDGNIMLHASKFVGPDPPLLNEGTACYTPDLAQPEFLRLVDCTDFATPLDDELYTEVVVNITGPDPSFRRVTIDGQFALEDCDCCGAVFPCYDTGTRSIFRTCEVSPDSPTDSFVVGQSDICVDEIGVRLEGTCTWKPDLSVKVTLTGKFFEWEEDSCGGSDLADTAVREFTVFRDIPRDDITMHLWNYGTCGPVDCNDTATSYGFYVTNEVAP